MLQLKLEEIVKEAAQGKRQKTAQQEAKELLIELKEGRQIKIGRLSEKTNMSKLSETALTGVYLHECEGTMVFLYINDRTVSFNQGRFRFNDDGTLVYYNECIHGTYVIPAGSGELLLIPQAPKGEYKLVKSGDQFLLGFPQARYGQKFKATVIEI